MIDYEYQQTLREKVLKEAQEVAAVGFFSSTSMAAVSIGLTAFIRSGGQMRLVTSPKLSDENIEAIAQGLQQREQIIEKALLRELEQELEQVVRDRLPFWHCRDF
ncbi:MAG: hypothetical protein ACFE0J_05875 [Elainellaceae cyanobacterium]